MTDLKKETSLLPQVDYVDSRVPVCALTQAPPHPRHSGSLLVLCLEYGVLFSPHLCGFEDVRNRKYGEVVGPHT